MRIRYSLRSYYLKFPPPPNPLPRRERGLFFFLPRRKKNQKRSCGETTVPHAPLKALTWGLRDATADVTRYSLRSYYLQFPHPRPLPKGGEMCSCPNLV